VAVKSESNMGGGQAPKRVSMAFDCGLPLLPAGESIHCSGQVRVSVGIVGRKEGYLG